MAERLREVADLAPAGGVVLLGEQTELVGQPGQPLEQGARLGEPPVAREGIDQPERARQELTLVAREAVVGDGRGVARDEAVAAEVAPDGIDRPGDTLVVSR